MRKDNKYNHAGPSAEDRALEKFAEMMIEKISTLQSDWKKPWFTEGALTWPKNLSGREYNGMNAMMLMMHCEKEGFKLPVFCTFDRVVGLNYGKDKEGGKVLPMQRAMNYPRCPSTKEASPSLYSSPPSPVLTRRRRRRLSMITTSDFQRRIGRNTTSIRNCLSITSSMLTRRT